MKKLIDLHTHTTASDGSYSPEEVVKMAKKAGLLSIAITDHDTIDGLDAGEMAAKKYQIEFIRGCEINTRYSYPNSSQENSDDNSHVVHILGLFIPHDLENYPNFTNALADFQTKRELRNMAMIEKLNQLGINITYSDLKKLAGGEIIARPHFAQYLTNQKLVNSTGEAFEKYLKKGRPAYVQRESIYTHEAIELLNSIGAITVLAHPKLISVPNEKLEAIVSDLSNHGLVAIEAYHSSQNRADERYLIELAKKNNLLLSGGSDFHGKPKPNISIGKGKGDLNIPYFILENLKKYKNF